MTQLDFEIVLRKLKNIQKYLIQLQTKAKLSQTDYEENFEQQLIVERLLHLLVESAVDVNTHIIVSHNQTPPETYRVSFLAIGKIGVISMSLAKELAPAAGLRNRLVHDYDDIDLEVVYQSIAFALRLFPQYLQQVRAYLQKERK